MKCSHVSHSRASTKLVMYVTGVQHDNNDDFCENDDKTAG